MAEFLNDLLRPTAYDHPVDAVEVVQTHISYVLIAGAYAYKIKKPLDLGFLDYSSLPRRRRMCEDEVRLNRRLCEDIYLGVVPITRRVDGRHRLGGSGEPVEFAVKMRRVSEERMMPQLLAGGGLEQRHLARLAAKIAAFHRNAETNDLISKFGTLPAVRANWIENFEQTALSVGQKLMPGQPSGVRHYVEQFLAEHGDLINERADEGRVRDSHGDLRADSVVFATDGSVCVMDCIEFNERLRYGDVASDVAFLAMDLEFRGYRREAYEFLSFYLEALGSDETLTVVLMFYEIYRAFIRGKVDSMLAEETEVPTAQRSQAADRSARYFELAAAWAGTRYRQQLVVMSGFSGTGKSFIGRAVAARLGAALVSSDVLREETQLASESGPFGEGSYSLEQRERVYEMMFHRAHHHLERRRSVVLDATFLTREQRQAAARIAAMRGVPMLVLQVTADEGTVRDRLTARSAGKSTSDARWDTYLGQRAQSEPLDEIGPEQLITLDSFEPLDHLVDRVSEFSRS